MLAATAPNPNNHSQPRDGPADTTPLRGGVFMFAARNELRYHPLGGWSFMFAARDELNMILRYHPLAGWSFHVRC